MFYKEICELSPPPTSAIYANSRMSGQTNSTSVLSFWCSLDTFLFQHVFVCCVFSCVFHNWWDPVFFCFLFPLVSVIIASCDTIKNWIELNWELPIRFVPKWQLACLPRSPKGSLCSAPFQVSLTRPVTRPLTVTFVLLWSCDHPLSEQSPQPDKVCTNSLTTRESDASEDGRQTTQLLFGSYIISSLTCYPHKFVRYQSYTSYGVYLKIDMVTVPFIRGFIIWIRSCSAVLRF